MRRVLVLAALLSTLPFLSLFVVADEARDAPTCTTLFETTIQAFDVGNGECSTYRIGSVSSDTVLEFNLSISGDAIDFLMMTENVHVAYSGGYAYGHVIEPSSLLFANGTYSFHWRPDANDMTKEFHLVFDNLAHDNDAGEGDQGGSEATVQVQINEVTDSYWTEFHNLVIMEVGSHQELLGSDELSLDAGTQIMVSAWPMFGEPDIYLMTEQHKTTYLNGDSGAFHIPGAAMTAISGNSTMMWTISESQAGEGLYLMVDNEGSPSGGGSGSLEARVSIKVEFDPVLAPLISDDLNSTAAVIGQEVVLNAHSTPNRQSQIQSLSWDVDLGDDSDGDGTLDNDADATGWSATASWFTPGTHRVLLTVTSPNGDEAQSIHEVSIIDVVAPTVSISHDTSSNTQNQALAPIGEVITFTANINDDHTIQGKRWTLDGVEVGTGNSWSKGWMNPSSHVLVLEATDVSGNIGNATLSINVIDSTVPTLDASKVKVPVSVTAGEGFTLNAIDAGSDSFDDDSSLEYRWDFNLDEDLDGDGIKNNDAELMGQTVGPIKYDDKDVGEVSIRLTIVDPSGNMVYKGYTIQVEPAPESNTGMVISIVIIILAAIIAVGSFMWRQKEIGMARNLLASHGLTEEEISVRISSIRETRNVSFFAKAVVIAGLAEGTGPMTEEQIAEKAKKAEMQRLYGSSGGGDPNAGFRPAGSSRPESDAEFAAMAGIAGGGAPLDASQAAAAAEAAALFSDQQPGQVEFQKEVPIIPDSSLGDEIFEQIETHSATKQQPRPATGARSGGISIPGQSTPTPSPSPSPSPAAASAASAASGMRGSCSSCGQGFMVQLPSGVNEVLVDCPKCGVEQHFSR